MRALGRFSKRLDELLRLGHSSKKSCVLLPQRRTMTNAAQRRSATTVAGQPLSYSVIDHHYEYNLSLEIIVQWLKFIAQ